MATVHSSSSGFYGGEGSSTPYSSDDVEKTAKTVYVMTLGITIGFTVLYAGFFVGLIIRRVRSVKRVTIYNYLIAGAFFRFASYALSIIVMTIPLSKVSIVLVACSTFFYYVTTFCVAEAAVETIFNWNDSAPNPASVAHGYRHSKSRRAANIARHICFSLALLFGLVSVFFGLAAIPAVFIFIVTGITVIISALVVLRRRREGWAVEGGIAMTILLVVYGLWLMGVGSYHAIHMFKGTRSILGIRAIFAYILLGQDLVLFLFTILMRIENMDNPRLIGRKRSAHEKQQDLQRAALIGTYHAEVPYNR